MKTIRDQEFGGERPLYASHDLQLENVVIHEGESGLKECTNIVTRNCRFEGNYVLWRIDGLEMENCTIAEPSRASLWYSKNVVMKDCVVDGPKLLREVDDITLERVKFTDGQETLWHCRGVKMSDCEMENGIYPFMHCENVEISNFNCKGKYIFQYAKNVVVRNAVIETKDAFWESDNCTVYDSTIKGEFLAWHSRNLKLVRCHIEGTQPFCYAEGLVLEDCTMGDNADLAFEYSNVNATIKGHAVSIKNPHHGSIKVDSVGEIIIDENLIADSDCKIEVADE